MAKIRGQLLLFLNATQWKIFSMSSQVPAEPLNAEERFRQAFERLKAGQPRVVSATARPLVTQNNVAKEAGGKTSALKKARFPALVREIQAYVELRQDDVQIGERQKRRNATRSSDERNQNTARQRDASHSLLCSAEFRIVELTAEVKELRRQLDEVSPTLPVRIPKRPHG